ncbi:MAG: glycosyltransferase, partial [Bacteroidota bacterium]
KIVLDRGYKVSFLAIGEGSHKQEYQSTLKKKYKRHILFPGLQKEIESIIQLFDIGVLLTNSDIHGEGISNSILEYMASGKAVIATDTGGSSEIIQQNKTGFLLPPKSVELVASCMIHLLENPELARQMGEKGKKRIQDHFSLQRMTDTYMEHYHEALNLPYKAFYAEETLESVLA